MRSVFPIGNTWRPAYTRAVLDSRELEGRATQLLQRLIQFDTVNPPGAEEECQQYLRGLLEGAGFEVELLAAVPGRPNLVARLPALGDAWPARPWAVSEKRKTPFSATQTG